MRGVEAMRGVAQAILLEELTLKPRKSQLEEGCPGTENSKCKGPEVS